MGRLASTCCHIISLIILPIEDSRLNYCSFYKISSVSLPTKKKKKRIICETPAITNTFVYNKMGVYVCICMHAHTYKTHIYLHILLSLYRGLSIPPLTHSTYVLIVYPEVTVFFNKQRCLLERNFKC